MQVDIDHLRQWIGREQVEAERLSRTLVRQFNATFDRQSGAEEGDIAPLLIHFCLTQPIAPTSELGDDGHPARGGFLPPVPLPRRMWAGGAFSFQDDIRVGEIVERRSTIRDVVLKEGRTGVLCFVTVEHEIRSGGRDVLTERQDIVYRDATAPGDTAGRMPERASEGTHRTVIRPTAPLLFRYSAMTFNGHRIHYDKAYVTEVEGYPGLIVHGPLQATLLAQMAADIRGARPTAFRFRSLSPLFDNADFSLNASEDWDGLKVWTARAGGPVAMEARAEW
ncbi:FAS1-like dehydratase domain-containing protein [Chachezhania antarctica]|uniref:FAS1-like dehydratase domain-containing protein n=1 Tax=Chachezhania antarctica TaxID=2340860 RepID=UPI000EB0E49C|nr:MaoC family dehydratase N-terminal domain-containing protein [Chachezhania antarctica]